MDVVPLALLRLAGNVLEVPPPVQILAVISAQTARLSREPLLNTETMET